jgi:hypothetical protein
MQLLPGLHTPIGARNIPLADPPEESPPFPTVWTTGTAVRKLGVDDAPLALVQAQPDAAEGDASASAVRIRAIGASADADEVVPPTALMRDEAAEKLWPGALVRVRRTVLEPSGGWGAVSHDSIGVLRTRHLTDGSASVDFSSDDHPNWACRLDEIEEMAISEAPPMPGFAELRVGAPVRVRESVTTPRGGWGGLDRWIREVGRERIVGRVLGFKMIEQPGEAMSEVENVRVAFPDFGHVWNAAPSELELEIAALSIVIGARVKVRATVARARGRPRACKCSPRRPRFPTGARHSGAPAVLVARRSGPSLGGQRAPRDAGRRVLRALRRLTSLALLRSG